MKVRIVARCSTHGEERNAYIIFFGRPHGKRDGDINIIVLKWDLGIGCEEVNWISER
jgi:hypothetical protein